MGKIKKHLPVKLVIGFIFKDRAEYASAKALLTKKFGPVDFESQTLPFTHTDYYENEFGKGLKRSFASFKKLIPVEELPKIKTSTNGFEEKLSRNQFRRPPRTHELRVINIDPGYLSLSKFVLATTKDYKHRIYIGSGIYGEITLYYQGKTFRAWEWTYPDYRTEEYIEIFNRIREIYAGQLKTQI